MAPGLPVLMYHEVLAPGASPARPGPGYGHYVVEQKALAAHLDRLATAGARGISTGDALRGDQNGSAVVLTFDDGCASDLLVAAPLLEAAGCGATFYITVDWLGSPGFLQFDQVRELARRGFEIGSHSLSHAYLSDLPADQIRIELGESRDRLEAIAGVPVRQLSCPGGRWSPQVAAIARELGYLGVSDSRPVAWVPGSDPFRVGRFAVTRAIGADHIERLVRAGAWPGAGLKSRVLDAAKSILGNRLYEQARTILLERWEPRAP